MPPQMQRTLARGARRWSLGKRRRGARRHCRGVLQSMCRLRGADCSVRRGRRRGRVSIVGRRRFGTGMGMAEERRRPARGGWHHLHRGSARCRLARRATAGARRARVEQGVVRERVSGRLQLLRRGRPLGTECAAPTWLAGSGLALASSPRGCDGAGLRRGASTHARSGSKTGADSSLTSRIVRAGERARARAQPGDSRRAILRSLATARAERTPCGDRSVPVRLAF